MKLFVIAITLLGVAISTSWAATKDCGCLPGREGEPGPMGNQGRKGDTGQKGENGFRGDQGDTGPRGPKGSTGNKGEPGRNAPIPGVEPTFGPAGEAGPRGRCLCNARRFRDPVIAGDMFLTDEKGEPNFIGDDLKEDDINRMFEHDETTPAPETFKIQAAPNHNGLFMMNANGVLVPVTDANVYDLFAAASAVNNNNNNNNTPPPQAANDELTPPPQAANDEFVLPEAANEDLTRQTSTTRRTTTTRRPYYNNNNYGNSHNNIYVMGPKGSLIPIDALGFKKKLMHLHGHGHGHGHGYGHNNGNYHGGNHHGGNHHGGNYHSNNYHGGNYHGNNYHGGHGHVSYVPHKKFGGYHTSSNGYHTNSNNGGYHTSPNSGGSGGYHTNSNNGGYHYDSRGSSSYNKWLRGILIGEDEPDITNDHADNEDTDDVVTVVKVDATKLRSLNDNDSVNDEELMTDIEEVMEEY